MLLLIDYPSLLHRAFHSLPPSVPMQGVLGFLNMLARLLGDRRPDRLAVAVDEDWRAGFRVAAFPAYKAHRVSDEPDPVAPQEALGRRVLAALGIAVVGAEGFEAEDVIATLATRAAEPVEIVSGDRDLFAVVRDPGVRVLYPVAGVRNLVEVDEAEITRRYGIPGRAYGDFAVLRGDPSDGLPGVVGIGEKTAGHLIETYGSLAAVLAAEDVPPAIRRRLDAAAHYLVAAERVALPATDVPLPALGLELPAAPAAPRTLARLGRLHRLAPAIARVEAALRALREPSGARGPSAVRKGSGRPARAAAPRRPRAREHHRR